MTTPPSLPYAVFSGAFGDNTTGGWYPARAEVSNGLITLWTASPSGWAPLFSAPASQVVVKSAAQRITLVFGGQSYPILARVRAVGRAVNYGVQGVVADVLDKPVYEAGVDLGRGVNQATAAASWGTQGGPEFIAAARASGAQVSRLGYGPLFAIGCGGGLFLALLVTVVTVLVIR